MDKINPTRLAEMSGISVPFASQIIGGTRKPSLETALRIYDATGLQFGPLVNLDRRGIDVARQMAT